MASLRQIRARIKSIQNSKQIMRAMQLVSGSKLKRSQDKLMQSRMVLEFLDGLLARVLAASKDEKPPTLRERVATRAKVIGKAAVAKLRRKPVVEAAAEAGHPLTRPNNNPSSALVIFTSDTGLCGSYNTNLVQLAEAHLRRDAARSTQLVFIGKRAYRYFTKRGYKAVEAHLDLAGRPNLARAEAIGRSLMDRFLSGQVGSISVLYSRYMSATVYKPTIQQWLPVKLESLQAVGDKPAAGAKAAASAGRAATKAQAQAEPTEYIFEPSPERVFEQLLPRWALTTFQLMLLEAFTSEHSARMIAMKNATDNAQELLTELTMQRNKIRQAAITKELSEIVGTVEALK